MTSHAFDAWADANLDPQADDGQQAAVNTLKDICQLADANLPAAEALFRCRRIASATLTRLGAPAAIEVEDLGGPSSLWCDDETAYIGETLLPEPPPF